MSLIDYTYFQKRLLAVPNLQGAVLEELNDYIDVFEDGYFDIILGIALKTEFLDGLEEASIDQKWLDLRDGIIYVVDDVTYEWGGFLNIDKVSPIANYVSCNLVTDNQKINAGIGQIISKAENGLVVTPQYRVSKIWNNAIMMNKSLFHFLSSYPDDYNNWCPCPTHSKSLLEYDSNIWF